MRAHQWIGMGMALALVASARPAASAPLEAVAGYDIQSGPAEQTVRTSFAGIGQSLAPSVGVSLLVARSVESEFGPSHAVAGGLVVATSPWVRLRGLAVQSIAAPEGASFTRWIAGPEVGRANAVRAGLFYTLETNESGDRAQGGRAELTAPLARSWTATVQASRASIPGAGAAQQASVGLGWKPVPLLEIVGQVGLARGAAPPGFVPRRSALERLLGDPPPEAAAETTDASRVALVGLRVAFP